MFRWFPTSSKRNQCIIKSKLLLLGSPYFYKDEAVYMFGKNEMARFNYLFKLMMSIHNDIINHLQAQCKHQVSDSYANQLKLLGASMSRLMRHVEVLHEGLENLTREQFQKYVSDINETFNILESLDEQTIEHLDIPSKKIETLGESQDFPQ